MEKNCHWRGRLQCFVRRGLGTASRLAFLCPRGAWEECTMMRRRPRLRLLLLLPRTLVLRAWWQGIRGCIHGVLLAVPEHAPVRPTSGQQHEEPGVGVDGFRSLRLRWIKPRCAVRGCGRQAWNERIDQNI